MAMLFLKGIATKMGWDYRYYDTSFYEKGMDSVVEKENTGSFKPAPKETVPETNSLISTFIFSRVIEAINKLNFLKIMT